jgi:hypothetical protein
MRTVVYKRFDPRVMESEERICIGINRGLPTMVFSYHPFYFDFHSARIIFDVSSGFYL